MKKRFFCLALLCVVFTNCLISPAAAISVRASDQIIRYSTDVTAMGKGRIAIGFSVLGTDIMDSIGAQKIQIYEQVGSRWILVEAYDQDDKGMSDTDTNNYANTVYYDGTSGVYYRIVITIFAEDSYGIDSRSKVHYVTA